jgi:hypothetical protein
MSSLVESSPRLRVPLNFFLAALEKNTKVSHRGGREPDDNNKGNNNLHPDGRPYSQENPIEGHQRQYRGERKGIGFAPQCRSLRRIPPTIVPHTVFSPRTHSHTVCRVTTIQSSEAASRPWWNVVPDRKATELYRTGQLGLHDQYEGFTLSVDGDRQGICSLIERDSVQYPTAMAGGG